MSLGTLISILLAAVLAFGLDPVVAGLVTPRLEPRTGVAVRRSRRCSSRCSCSSSDRGSDVGADHRVRAVAARVWNELASKPGFQDILSTAGADEHVANALKELAAGLPDAASALLGLAGNVFGSVLELVTLTFLALFLLMERPMITDWLFGYTPPEADERWRPVVENSIRAISTSLIGNVAISCIAATVAGVSAWAFELPFPLVLAVITGLLDLIPQVGATIAAVILVAVGLTVSTEAAIAMLIDPADLPAARELRRLSDRLSQGGLAHRLHDDRRPC